MELEKKISDGIMQAMKEGDAVRRDTLRNVKKLILEAKTAGPSKDSLADDEVLRIIRKLAKQGADSAELYHGQGREDLAKYEQEQVDVLTEYLPAMMNDEQLTGAVREIISQTGAQSMKDMGKVMGVASKTLAGKAEGKDISAKVKELLS